MVIQLIESMVIVLWCRIFSQLEFRCCYRIVNISLFKLVLIRIPKLDKIFIPQLVFDFPHSKLFFPTELSCQFARPNCFCVWSYLYLLVCLIIRTLLINRSIWPSLMLGYWFFNNSLAWTHLCGPRYANWASIDINFWSNYTPEIKYESGCLYQVDNSYHRVICYLHMYLLDIFIGCSIDDLSD